MQDTNNLFHAPGVPLNPHRNLSEAFPEAMDNKGVV
jgi:hypothetical protein